MSIPETMKAIVLEGHGGLEQLVWHEDWPTPRPGPGEVLIRVGACGLNNTDVNTRLAWYSKGAGDSADATWSGQSLTFPHIQGADACGVIEAVGEGISTERIGTRVLIEPCLREANGAALASPWYLGSECPGSFAEFTTVASRHAHAEIRDCAYGHRGSSREWKRQPAGRVPRGLGRALRFLR